jgi:hypothetical protein
VTSITLIFHRLLLVWLPLLAQQTIAIPVFVKLLNGLVVVMFVKNSKFEIQIWNTNFKIICFVNICSSDEYQVLEILFLLKWNSKNRSFVGISCDILWVFENKKSISFSKNATFNMYFRGVNKGGQLPPRFCQNSKRRRAVVVARRITTKGQLISKGIFGILEFFQKMNERIRS